MKKFLKIAAVVLLVAGVQQSFASTIKSDTTKFGTKVKHGLQKAGNKTAQIAVKGASAVGDKTYKGKSGPAGETVYINKNDHYYYVNSKGGKVYVKKSQLKDKVEPK